MAQKKLNNPIRLKSTNKIRNLTPQEKVAGQNVMQQCLAVKPNEKVLIITDPQKQKLEAAIFFETAKNYTNQVELISFADMTGNAQEPPKEIAKKMAQSDVALLVTTYSLSHTQARKNACQKGTRIASMPDITQDMIVRTLSSDYSQIAQTSQKIAKILTQGKKVNINAPGGTDLKLSINNRQAIADTGFFTQPGDFGNLPAGEAFIAPLEKQTQGIIVFDGAFADIVLDKPIKIIVKNGQATSITGGQAAQKLVKLVNQISSKARIIGELGIGTNPKAKLSPNVLEAEKVYGTCHLALGNNATFGGTNSVSFHSDGIIKNPTVTINNQTIIKNGKINLKGG